MRFLSSLLFIFSLSFFIPYQTEAASLELRLVSSSLEVGDQFEVKVFLKIESGESVNALEGEVVFPQDLLSLLATPSGNSVISLWIENLEDKGGRIPFAGIIPGGLAEPRTYELFGAVFETKKSGQGELSLQKNSILSHEEPPLSLEVKTTPLQILINQRTSTTTDKFAFNDRDPPEPFIPLLVKEPELFEGDYVLVFSTTDKGSGINRYEVLEIPQGGSREGREGEWEVTTSPYRLKDQSLKSSVYIRAVDNADNFTEVRFGEKLSFIETKDGIMPFVIAGIALILLVLILSYGRRKKYPNSH